ncbi:MAG: glycine zipper 2TM domain-containing protein [Alphaproteobacteria bacterium]|nr:glycine zipper 2TM domain-containing protein [Alphaproteobacteria bacterium]
MIVRYARDALGGLALLGLAACQGGGGMDRTAIGTVGGAALGGLAGAQFGGGTGQLVATAAGTLLGAVVGGQLAKDLAPVDQTAAAAAERRALAQNAPVTWTNPDTDRSGTVEPLRTYQSDGRYCREYVHTVYIDGRAERAHGTACREADGTWALIG